ncbi:beta-lactamase family protein [Qipengyuania sp. 6B39]|uniref:serine hydrolase domain-containing protein n=1 Tax=Qipengyuania proteolytica TaxID=2867239 RepID=UPI001C8A90BF|nr:serine hydrolase domain-containing protein [Qipengyuania proteolytica]MBX7495742.1 beta-lactamase family protein [Qipengyuania proteolytica]
MKRFALIASALLLTTSPLPLLAQEQAQTEAVEKLDTGTGAEMAPIPGWAREQRNGMLVFTAPEGDVTAAIVGVDGGEDGSKAVANAWQKLSPGFAREVLIAQDPPARDGWDQITVVNYKSSPEEKIAVQGIGLRKGAQWTVILIDGALATVAKRGAQLNQAFGSLRPANFEKETFAGKAANELTPERIAELTGFVTRAMEGLEIPGVGLALVQGDRIVWEGGLGVTEKGGAEQVDKDTGFMVASNTKGMATLLLSTLVDEGKLAWDQKVTEVYPEFRLGSGETTASVRVEHLICACTGLPRKDMQWIMNTSRDTPASDTFVQLAATEPTSGFGEVFQYNNLMASAAGYIGGHLVYPDMEIGAAFDRAMDERIFDPLGMTRTTFDFSEAMRANWARPHARGYDGPVEGAPMDWNYMVHPYRPAGGVWSTAHDMALYAMNELREGTLADGTDLVSAENLLKRRERYVPIGEDSWYGMGLMEDASRGKEIYFHGGSLIGYKSNFWFIPEDGVAAVLLTNSDTGQGLLGLFQRKLLEVLYDGAAEAEENLAASVKLGAEAREKAREGIVPEGDPTVLASLASRYSNPELGPLTVSREGEDTFIAVTSGRSRIGTLQNDDGTSSIVFMTPGFFGFPLVIGESEGKRTLKLLDAQHEYVFVEDAG